MAKLDLPVCLDYRSLVGHMNGRDRRKIGNNTWLHHNVEARSIDVRLHSTIVARVFADGTMSVNSGGWHSVTTKNRINAFLPDRYVLGQTKRVWYIHDRYDNWSSQDFYDHMRFPQRHTTDSELPV